MLQKVLVVVLVVAGIAGCIGCSTSSHYLYATIPAANELAAYREDPYSGTLTQLAGSPYTVGDEDTSVVLHPSNKYLYVVNPGQGEDDISLFDIESNGTLTEVPPRTPVGSGASQPTLLVMDPSGNYLYTMNTSSNNISVFTIGSSGALSPLMNSQTQLPYGPFPVGAPMLNMQVTPSGNYLFVTSSSPVSSNSAPYGSISAYSLNAGVLTLAGPPTNSLGSNPYGLVIDPTGSFLYTGNYTSNSISIFSIAASGALTNVNQSPLDDIYNDPLYLMMDSKGLYLYVANQGSNNVAVYSIDSTTGLPEALTTSTSTFAFTTEANPSFLAEDPGGHYLFVGNKGGSAAIQGFQVTNGNLNPLVTYGVGNSPTSIVIVQ